MMSLKAREPGGVGNRPQRGREAAGSLPPALAVHGPAQTNPDSFLDSLTRIAWGLTYPAPVRQVKGWSRCCIFGIIPQHLLGSIYGENQK